MDPTTVPPVEAERQRREAKKDDPPDVVHAFKGFKPDLTCRGFQFEEGGTYEHDGPVEVCSAGFHAVLLPLDVFHYYRPTESVYHLVELEGVTPRQGDDSKAAARKITVGASIGVPGLVRAHVEAIWSQVKKSSEKKKATTGRYANAATTGDSANAATTGYSANAATTGDSANAATTGDSANAATTGYYAHAATTGRYANAATTGYSAQIRSSVADPTAVAAVLGQGAAKGALGSWLVLTERDGDWNILGVQAVQVDGERLLPDTYYTLRGGQVVSA